jgi:calcineurin-like phosphoesterase family protein
MTEHWLGGDTHFEHPAILRYAPRPAADVVEMRELLIERWNAHVAPHDVVWHHGDFAIVSGPREARMALLEGIFAALHGIKHLLIGNHDGQDVRRLPWRSIQDTHRLKVDGHRIWMAHYPHVTWPQAHQGTWHTHGHTHGNLDPSLPPTTRLDVGIDTHPELRPYNLDEVVAFMREREYHAVDHHTKGRD